MIFRHILERRCPTRPKSQKPFRATRTPSFAIVAPNQSAVFPLASQTPAKPFDVDGLAYQPRRTVVIALERTELHALIAGSRHDTGKTRGTIKSSVACISLHAKPCRTAKSTVDLLATRFVRVVHIDVTGFSKRTSAVGLIVGIALEVFEGRRIVRTTRIDVLLKRVFSSVPNRSRAGTARPFSAFAAASVVAVCEFDASATSTKPHGKRHDCAHDCRH